MNTQLPLTCADGLGLLAALSLTASALMAAPQHDPGFQPRLDPERLMRTADGAFAADGAGWRARFDTAGARIDTCHPSGGMATATLRLVDHGRRGHVRSVAQLPARQRGDTFVHYAHDGVLERYRVDDGGFEQSFVIPRRPDGDGDYVLGITATGPDLEVPERAAGHQALELRVQGEPAIRYGEAFAFERGGTPVEIATRCDGTGRIELIVPASLLDRASYPLVVDPAVGPVFLPSGATLNDTTPDVAYHVAQDRYAFVWQRIFSFTTEIRGRLYDAAGNPLTSVVTLTSSSQARNPSVCSVNLNGQGFAVAYEQAGQIRLRSFSATDLTPLTPEVVASNPPGGASDANPSLSGDGVIQAILTYDRTPAGASNPNQILLASVYVTNQLLVSAGTVVESVTSGYVQRPRIARTLVYRDIGGQPWRTSRVVWERFYPSPAPGDVDLRTATVRALFSNVAVDNGPSTVAGAGSIGPSESRGDIAMIGTSLADPDPLFLIAWQEESDVKAHRYGLTAPIGTEIDVRSTSDFEGGPAVGAGACEFTVGYLEIIPPNEFAVNVRAARVLRDGTVPVDHSPIDVLNGPFQSDLRASSLPASASGGRRVNTCMLAWWGQTGSASGLNDVRARRYDPVSAGESPFGSACPGPLGELPTIGSDGAPIPGNVDWAVTVDNAPANSLAVLLVGNMLTTLPVPGAPGCQLYLGLPALTVYPAVTNAGGFGTATVPIPCGFPPGVTLAFQWGIYTPGNNAFGWITSDDLDVTWQQ